jgi:alkaline phosphatase D
LDIEHRQFKRVHQIAIRAVLDGQIAEAIEALERRSPEHPEDAETRFALAVAHAYDGNQEAALASAQEALSLGLPPGRFAAELDNLLEPLADYEPFAALVAEHSPALVHGPMVGAVTGHSARVWVRTMNAAQVQVRASTEPDMTDAVKSAVVEALAEEDFTAEAELNGLAPNTVYSYEVILDGETFQGEPAWTFQTFPEAGQSSRFTIGFGGGAGYVPENERMWDTIREREPLAFLFLGDNIYSDDPETPEMQRFCYYRRQSRPEYRRFLGHTSVFAIWDDHDFGTNDCWGGPAIDDPPWKIPVWRVFRQNWANPAYGGGEEQPGCWFRFAIGDVDFIMLDGRYYRTDPETPEPSMLGPAQKAWLFEQLADLEGTFKVLVSPVPWAEGTKGGSPDTWDGYAEERAEIYRFLSGNRIEGVVLLSADRHRSDLWRIEREEGYALYEFESSRLTNQHVHQTMEAAVFSYNEKQSVGIVDFDTTLDDPEVRYTIVSIDGEDIFDFTIKHSELQHTE